MTAEDEEKGAAAATAATAADSSPELSPLSLADGALDGTGGDGVLVPLPAYKAAGETVLGFDGLLRPAGALRLREDLREGCGGQTWPAGMVLARHLLRYRRAELAGARVLELGAGGGLVGLAAALACRADRAADRGPATAAPPTEPAWCITDQTPMLALMQHNIALNGLERDVRALVLNWGEPLPDEVRRLRPNVVLAADCVYFEPAFPLLLATLDDLLSLDGQTPTVVYFCFKKRRRADMQFLKKARKRFCVAEAADEDRPVFSREGLFLYTITRRDSKAVQRA